MTQVPIACTLTVAEQPGRIEEWRTLLARATATEQQEDGTWRVTFAPDAASAVEDLARREMACCAFFELGVTVTEHAVVLRAAASTEAASLLADLLAPG